MKKNTALWIGILMLIGLLFIMFVAPYMSFVDRELIQEKHRFTGIPGKMLQLPPYEPSEKNPLGSDDKGVDNLSKLILGAKETVFAVLIIAVVRYIIAIPLGLLAYKQRGLANFIIKSLNQVFSNIPTIIAAALLLSLPAFLNTPNRFMWAVLFIAVLEVGRVAFLVQQQTYRIAMEPFVEAGTALGLSGTRMTRKYYFPAILPEIVVNFCIDIGKVMLLIGQLGVLSIFLSHAWEDTTGFGTYAFVNTSTNWFALISEHRMDIYMEKFAFVFAPALGIMYVILTFNVIGEGLRQFYNHKMNRYL